MSIQHERIIGPADLPACPRDYFLGKHPVCTTVTFDFIYIAPDPNPVGVSPKRGTKGPPDDPLPNHKV